MVELHGNKIIYEDNHILIVEKMPGIGVQEDESGKLDLLNLLKGYIKEKYNKPGNVYLGLVHRLDKPVGGLMVFARTSKAASRLSEIIRKNEFKKTYYAVVCNKIKDKDTLIDYLIKDTNKNIVSISDKEHGKYSELDYEVIKRNNDLSLVKINLHTGRSHQIRVQFASRGNPLYADQRYNKMAVANKDIALFAGELSFKHPVLNEIMTFKLDLPNRYPFDIFKNQ